MKVMYVAGKYRADSWNGVYENILHARQEARKLWLAGWAVICPHANTYFMDGAGGETDGIFLAGDLELIRRSDAIYMLEGWKDSVGAKEEYELALELNMPIYYEGEIDLHDR